MSGWSSTGVRPRTTSAISTNTWRTICKHFSRSIRAWLSSILPRMSAPDFKPWTSSVGGSRGSTSMVIYVVQLVQAQAAVRRRVPALAMGRSGPTKSGPCHAVLPRAPHPTDGREYPGHMAGLTRLCIYYINNHGQTVQEKPERLRENRDVWAHPTGSRRKWDEVCSLRAPASSAMEDPLLVLRTDSRFNGRC